MNGCEEQISRSRGDCWREMFMKEVLYREILGQDANLLTNSRADSNYSYDK